ncbi:hypothetical protein QQS21_007721 [Conoideocrella luteorostrata]|uniref:Uncharacterized protein n=1 Tax=Conoideocrella luteorostrata TaxID=1105319 RepID=A0AAJ0CKA4_9HYPO|nr:hypothetical protein QQS21_007721 [Conoideocrella luteorostrata]
MPEPKEPRPSKKRLLKQAPRPSTFVESSTAKSDVGYASPANQPQAESIRINTAHVPQPFLDPDALPSFRENGV